MLSAMTMFEFTLGSAGDDWVPEELADGRVPRARIAPSNPPGVLDLDPVGGDEATLTGVVLRSGCAALTGVL